jgi:hypothetical protein
MTNYYKFDSGLVLGHDLTALKGENSYNYLSGSSAIMYHKISNMAILAGTYFTKKLFEIEPHLIYYAEIQGPGILDPHIDHGATVVANFYFDANDSITTFYEPKEEAQSKVYTTMQSTGIYDLNSVRPIECFQAKDGESYILDVTKIHGVVSPKVGIRKFINMQWYGVDFNTLRDSLLV